MPHVVVRAFLAGAEGVGNTGLGAIQRLDLRLLVDAEHYRTARRLQVQPDDVGELCRRTKAPGRCRVGSHAGVRRFDITAG